MTNEDLSKLDFPIATMKMLESTTAMLRTVLQNQMEIMKALSIGNHEVISAEEIGYYRKILQSWMVI